MSNLIPFNFDDSLVRSALIDGQPWFVAKDIAQVLEYSRERDMHRILDDDEKGAHIVRTPGGDQEMTVINQSGLFHAIIKSRKPEAQRFRKWVTGDLLPTLYREGTYSLTQQGDRLRLESERLRLKTRDAALQLLDRITTERSQPVREALYPILEQDFQALGAKAPPLEAIGTALPASVALLDEFWEAVDHLEAGGVPVSHVSDQARIALNLPHLAEQAAANGVELPSLATLRRALRESQSPRFISHAATNSVITGRTMKCWVFERQVAADLDEA